MFEKEIKKIKYVSKQLLAAFERDKYIKRRLNQLIALNGKLLEEAKKVGQDDIISLTEQIGGEITKVQENLDNPQEGKKYVGTIIKLTSNFENEENYDMALRPHHVLGFAGHEANPNLYYLSDAQYIADFRKHKGDAHSDRLILHWRDTIKKLHENPKLRFKYVQGSDTVCQKCEHDKSCQMTVHEYYKLAKQADKDAIKELPELEFGEVYSGDDLIKLFKKKGWMK